MFFWRAALALVLLEIVVFAAVIGEIGFFAALGLWLLSVMIGGWLMQEQGLGVMARAQAAFDRGAVPVGELFESFCLFAAGALFILPGFVSDIIAFALLVPALRNVLRVKGAGYFGMKEADMRPYDDGVIDGVYERVQEKPGQIPPKSPEN